MNARARERAAMNGKEGETRTHASDLKNRREREEGGGGRGRDERELAFLRGGGEARQRSGADPAYVHERGGLLSRGFSSLPFFPFRRGNTRALAGPTASGRGEVALRASLREIPRNAR